MSERSAGTVQQQYAQAGDAPYRLYLRQDQIPTRWYNLRADMPEPPEPMRLPNGKVAEAADIAPVFCDALVAQELDDDTAYFDIPERVREMYQVYVPRRCAAPTTWSAHWARRRRSTTSSRATTRPARTS